MLGATIMDNKQGSEKVYDSEFNKSLLNLFPMASKFFADADNGASSESEDQKSEQSEEEKVVTKKPLYVESSSDEEEKRVVRTEKDKRYEALTNVISRIKEKMRVKDFIALNDEWDELNKQLEKSKKVIEKEGLPVFYLRICHKLENFCQNFPAEEKKSLKAANNKAYNTLKHKIKKNNKLFEDKLKEFADHPISSDEEKSDEEEEDKQKTKTKVKKDVDEEDDDYWLEDGAKEEEESDEDEEDVKKYLQSSDPQVRRNYWLKRETTKDKEEDEETRKKEEEEKRKKRAQRKIRKEIDESKFAPVEKKKELVNIEEMDKRIKEIVERRAGKKLAGKEYKKVSIEDEIEVLDNFLDQAKGDDIKRLEVILILMPARMDYAQQQNRYYMPRDLWLQNFETLQEYFKILKKRFRGLSQVRTFQKDDNSFYNENAIVESFSTHFDGLDNELWKAFKAIESSSMEYAERLRDHASMIKLINECVTFFKSVNDDHHEVKFSFKKIEYIYFIPDKLCAKLLTAASERSVDTKNEFYTETNSQSVISELASKIYKTHDNKLTVKTMLYHVYNHAINGRYHIAKEYLLMSHIGEASGSLDVNLQVMYNRVLVQLGLAAFSVGLIQETVNALTDIVSSLRLRELLGQSIAKNSVNEKEERRRMLPPHQHINTELIEAVHLIASMLIEIPNIVADPGEANKKQSAKFFRRQYEQYKNFYGPPESYKDFIIVAAKELHQGNWKKCYDNLMKVGILNKLTQDVQKVYINLLAKVKEQAFKCYLFTFQNCYDSIDIDQLAAKFDITKDYIHAFVSKMVFNKELKAFLDVDSNCLMFEREDNTRIENLSLNLADKVSNLLVNNEKIMDSKYGNYGFSDKDISEGIVKKKTTTKKKLNILNKDKRKGKGVIIFKFDLLNQKN